MFAHSAPRHPIGRWLSRALLCVLVLTVGAVPSLSLLPAPLRPLSLQPQENQVEKLQPAGARSKYGAESTTADDDDLPGDELAATRDKKGGNGAAKKKKKRRDDDDDDDDEEDVAPTKDQDIERLRLQYAGKDKPAGAKGTLVASAKFSKPTPTKFAAATAAAPVDDDEPAFLMRPAHQGKRINMKVLSANNSDDDNEPTPELDADRAGDEEARRLQSELDAQITAEPARRWSNNEETLEEGDYESAMPGASDDESRFQMNIQSSAVGGGGYADALEPTGFHLHHPGSYGGSALQSAATSKQHSRRTSQTDEERAMQARRDRRSTGTHTLQPPASHADTIHPSDRPSFSPTNAASSSSSRSGRDGGGYDPHHRGQDSLMVVPGQIDDGSSEQQQWARDQGAASSGVDSDGGAAADRRQPQQHARKQTKDRLQPTHPISHSPAHDADEADDGGTQPQQQQHPHSPQHKALSNGGAFGNNPSPQQRQRNVRAMALSQSRVDGDDTFDF